ncbi:MAG TPA: cytochrome c maturation protein CcmE [Hyphomonadaceae bacterium]|nr:cytochrome c maturation protein CcmE [Hyphomonadaceae bacterium]
MRKRSQRLWLIGAGAVLLTGALALGVIGFGKAASFFRSPSEIAEMGASNIKDAVRIGGLVEAGSETHNAKGQLVFKITDGSSSVPVVYDNIPPDLFQEGKGAVVEGKFDDSGTLVASRVLAKHDENYMSQEEYKTFRDKAAKEAAAVGKKEPGT